VKLVDGGSNFIFATTLIFVRRRADRRRQQSGDDDGRTIDRFVTGHFVINISFGESRSVPRPPFGQFFGRLSVHDLLTSLSSGETPPSTELISVPL